MKLLANENIPFLTIKKLREQGYDVFSISENKSGITDNEVLSFAREQNRIIITFDRDYGELLSDITQLLNSATQHKPVELL